MNKEIEVQYQDIVNRFPNAVLIKNRIFHLKLNLSKGITLEIDYSKYPKTPRVKLINEYGKVYKKLNNEIFSLKNWNVDKAKSVLKVIKEINDTLKIIQSNIVKIKGELLEGFLALCREHHPKEFLGILKLDKNVFTEFILPPGAITSRSSGLFFPNRIPINRYYQGTIHSHPSGILYPSLQDLNNLFKANKFNFIVGFPYSLNNVNCFDRNGIELQFKVTN